MQIAIITATKQQYSGAKLNFNIIFNIFKSTHIRTKLQCQFFNYIFSLLFQNFAFKYYYKTISKHNLNYNNMYISKIYNAPK